MVCLDVKETNKGDEFYITANFKSNQIQHLLKGQSAKIVMDDFPEISLSGKVSEIGKFKNGSPLISPNNQSGNYVRMIERFPVTIKIEMRPADKDKFKVQMSCAVSVNTAP